MYWMGFVGTVLIVVVLGVAFLLEPSRQEDAAAEQQAAQIVEGMDYYAENCALCHGAAGEGLGAYPPLSDEAIALMEAEDLFKTVARGRYGTQMAAYSVHEGGVFTDAQVNSLVTMIQYGDWAVVAARVDALGLTPPEIVVVELSDETLSEVTALPGGETLASGLTLYVENCASCHGANGEGSTRSPALNDETLRAQYTDDDLTRIIEQGVPGTLMAGWSRALTGTEIADLVTLVRRWDEIDAAGVEMPVVEVEPIDMSPEAIAAGGRLFDVLCVQCHGAEGYGTQMAPALNNQIFLDDTPDQMIQQIIAMGVPGTVMPAWTGRLSEADIAALTAFIRNWAPTAPPIVSP
jgi:cbb3-type cytochrome c oxidase subunit III